MIDIHNNIMIPFEYEDFIYFWGSVRIFIENENKKRTEKEVFIFEVRKEDKLGFVDWEGNILLPCEYEEIDIVCRDTKLYFETKKGK
ncbi:MAG: WG repeat-containing protein [Dysgonamonadaceae bacterium]|nr:WG repeat-containing protein [Dysgonamonadaceae bacterium]